MRKPYRLLILCLTLLAFATPPSLAGKPRPKKSNAHCDCSHCQAAAAARAGRPYTTSRLARPAYQGPYYGYYVGGSAPFFGEGKQSQEGTFGWDYTGILFTKKIFLNWRHQNSRTVKRDLYKTDGPHIKKHK